MKVMTSKSKNAESFYIAKSNINNEGKSTSTIIRKLGTLADLSKELDTDRDGVMAWAKEQARLETLKYKGFISLYEREKITDDLHDACGFRTDFEFISKRKMKEIQKKSKGRE